MPDWHQLYTDLSRSITPHDTLRRKHLKRLHKITKRNIIAYYSGWLIKSGQPGCVDMGITDADKTGFMTAVHKLDRRLGLDLLLHTPGGDMAATESLIHYLRSMFGTDIRAIIPQIAMSGGAMIACACKEIVMGAQSNIGPFDPQIGGVPSQAILADLKRAAEEMSANPQSAFLWQPILQKYNLGFFEACQNAINMADDVVKESLKTGMFKDELDAEKRAELIVENLGSNAKTQTHSRHIHKKQAREFGLKIVDLEDDQQLQDAVLSVHHACVLTFEQTHAVKIIENHNGRCHMGMVFPSPNPTARI